MKKISMLSGLLVCLLLGGCQALQVLGFKKPIARIEGVEFGDASLTSAQLLFDVEVENPYSVALPMTNLDYTLAIGDRSLLEGTSKLQNSIPAKTTQSVSLPVTINYLEFLNAVQDMELDIEKAIPYKAGISLTFDTPGWGDVTLPLKKEGKLDLMNVTVKDIIDIWNTIKK